MTDAPEKKTRRRRVHADEAAARVANLANVAARNTALRRTHVVKTIALPPETAARGVELIARRGLRGFGALVAQLVDEAFAKDTE